MAFKPFDLTGKVALVTGGNSGIGLGMAEGLAEAGADVVIWGTNPAKNRDAEARLKDYGQRVRAHRVDVSDEEAVEVAMDQILGEFGRVDTVIASAGVMQGAPSYGEMTSETWRKVLGVNLDGVFFTFRSACRHMVARAAEGDAGGSLVAISSTSAIHGAARNEAYGASKAAVCSLVRGLAVEYARHGVRANAVLPGWTATELTGELQQHPKFKDQVISRVPFRRWLQPEDFAGVAVYLASEASRFHTGDSLVLDGGYTVY